MYLLVTPEILIGAAAEKMENKKLSLVLVMSSMGMQQ